MCHIGFSQIKYPIQIKEGNDTIVKMKKSQADELNERIKADAKKIKKLSNENNKLSFKCDSLIALLKAKPNCTEADTLNDLRGRLKRLSLNGVLIYYCGGRDNLCYVNLSSYKIIFYANEMVKMIPLKSKLKVRVNSVGTDAIPQPKNLSLHFLPHDYKGKKFNF